MFSYIRILMAIILLAIPTHGSVAESEGEKSNSECEIIRYLIGEFISLGEMKQIPDRFLLNSASCYEVNDLDGFLSEAIVLRLRHDSKSLIFMEHLTYDGELHLWKAMANCCFGAVKLIIRDDIEYQIDLGSEAARDAYEEIYGEPYLTN